MNKIMNMVIILLVSNLITSCSNRDKIVTEINSAPAIAIGKGNDLGSVLTDSFKISLIQDKNYYFNLKIEDANSNISRISYDGSNLSVGIMKSGEFVPLLGKFPDLTPGTYAMCIKDPQAGNYKIDFTVEDASNAIVRATLNLAVFTNQKPVPKVIFSEMSRVGNDITVKVSLSASYDKDFNFGGEINKYFFSLFDIEAATITGSFTAESTSCVKDIIQNKNSQTVYTFKKGKTYLYKAYVIDNDNIRVGYPVENFLFWSPFTSNGSTLEDLKQNILNTAKLQACDSIIFN